MRISMKRTPAGVPAVFFFLVAVLAYLCSTTPAAANVAPTISGSPLAIVRVNSWYSWSPTVGDRDDAIRTLRFTVVNKPAWALFSVYSGKLEGKPTQAGTWSNIRITVSDGEATATLPGFAITASLTAGGGSGSNRAPTISGSPTTSLLAGTAYNFRPAASDPDGNALSFSVQNRPSWASFNASNGTLSGTPTSAQIGTYSNVTIAVSDGRTTVALPAFAITVSDVANGAATLSWTPPTRNSDGSTLTNLAGYRIYYGTSSSALNRTIQVSNAGIARYVVSNLSPATWYFTVRAYNSAGRESVASNVASKTVR